MASLKLTSFFVVGSIVTLLGACAAPEQDEEEIGETGSYVLAGNVLSREQVAGALRSAGFAENTIGTMVCTAKYESSFYSRATNKNKNGSTDRGIFQINSIHLNGGTKGCPNGGEALFDLDTNAKCALAIFKSQGIRAWYGYRAHKKECDAAKAPGSAAAPEPEEEETAPLPRPRPDVEDEPAIDDNGGGCYSESTASMKNPLACVQGATNKVWFQCNEGKWYRGGDADNGPYGPCNGSFPAK